ncbi:MAG: hypothetical protein COT17_03915 [Elusimicrobia bacterium CG08_land_8_20_14_0_20_51_18]|nr:MAG: hypothetical protein COT17_03915 [Elusimicrobia bacterium CG08_land_8_20_14_0_20_51_18]
MTSGVFYPPSHLPAGRQGKPSALDGRMPAAFVPRRAEESVTKLRRDSAFGNSGFQAGEFNF